MKLYRLFAIACVATAAVGCAPKYQVGDLYDQNGKTGIVFWTTDGGRHGKIVSLTGSEAAWQTGKGIEAVGAADQQNGAANLDSVARQQNWQKRFPAFAWCAELGEGWYLPAIGEFEQLGEHWQRVDTAVRNAGGDPLEDRYFYWSSTEANDYCAILWRGVNIPTDKKTKIYKMYIRAAAAF